MRHTYPFVDLRDTTALHRDEIAAAMMRVLDSGRYIGGDECAAFEKELAHKTFGAVEGFCVGVSNGLDALRLILRAYKELGLLKDGDEVIVPANTYIATVLAVTDMGLNPVLVEPDGATMNLDWNKVEENLTDKTRVVLTVHLYGRVSWNESVVEKLRERGILIIEDNAQAIGAVADNGISTGALGDAAAFSFYPTKNIGALGDAGAVTTADASVEAMVRALSNYGSDRRYHNIVEGYNCRLDSIQAAILRVKLRHIDQENERRRAIADIYSGHIKNPELTLPEFAGSETVWHQYVVRVADRERFTSFLDSRGVGWDIHYAVPPHRQPCYEEKFGALNLPVTDEMARTVVSLPISPSTSVSDAYAIARIINEYKP